MPEVRRLRKRGATIEVVAFGEILFAPDADVPRFLKRFSAKIRDFAALEAPANKRPRWAHYGKPLKETMRARTQLRRGTSVFHIHSAVGSTAPHAYYVDQGTGVFNGSGPYPASVLPPWTHGSPSLYENTWRPLGPDGRKVKQVFIKGQEGQHFFDKALDRGFAFMRLSAFHRPGEGVGGVSGVFRTEPAGLADFLGNTPGGAGFEASLTEWRAWRDAAWDSGRELGRHGGLNRRLDRGQSLKATRAAARRRRRGHNEAQAAKNTDIIRAHIVKVRGQETAQEKRRKARELKAALAAKKREEAAAKRRAADEARAVSETKERIFKSREREAHNYWNEIKRLYPNARLRPSPQHHLFRVEWVTQSGEKHHTDFTY